MKNVYIIVHETHGYMDGETFVDIEVFNDLKSSNLYFDSMKSNIIEEYINYDGCKTIQELSDKNYFYIDEEPTLNGDSYLYIDLDDYGYDKLRIYKKPIMSFNDN